MAIIDKEYIIEFQVKLLKWYEINARTFPWRMSNLSNYQIIIAETLLQRTKAKTVSKFYQGFIKKFSSWEALAEAKIEDLEDFLKPIGLYRQRANRLQKLTSEMIKRNGLIPNRRSDLETITFLGQYISNSVELLIFNKPVPLLDVNMARLLERYFGERHLVDIRYDPYLQKLSYDVVNHKKSKELSWAILDFAALVCKSRKPRCTACIFKLNCIFFIGHNNC